MPKIPAQSDALMVPSDKPLEATAPNVDIYKSQRAEFWRKENSRLQKNSRKKAHPSTDELNNRSVEQKDKRRHDEAKKAEIKFEIQAVWREKLRRTHPLKKPFIPHFEAPSRISFDENDPESMAEGTPIWLYTIMREKGCTDYFADTALTYPNRMDEDMEMFIKRIERILDIPRGRHYVDPDKHQVICRIHNNPFDNVMKLGTAEEYEPEYVPEYCEWGPPSGYETDSSEYDGDGLDVNDRLPEGI